MSNRKTTCCIIAFCIAVSFFAGCFPKDSLQWSKDGSKGIYSKSGALFIVDGNTGSLTQIAPNDTTTQWPAISPDGSHIAFGQVIKVDNFNDVLKQLPPNQAKPIEAHAEILKQKILIEGIKDGNFPFIGKSEDSFNPQHVAWVQRYLVENADKRLAEKIGPDLINKTKSKDLTYCWLVYAPTTDPNNRKILATSEQTIWRIRFSPDSRLIAYGVDRIKGNSEILEVGFDLYAAAPVEDIPAALIAPATAIGYDFKPDSRAIAYIRTEDEFIDIEKPALGSLVERTLIDPNGKFLASIEHLDGNDSPSMYVCTGEATELAGVLYHPWMHVSYARDNRIFFASVKMSLPSGKIDAEKQTIFCCDLFTNTVSEIMPQTAIDFSQGNMYLFALSGDSRRILLSGKKNTLALYGLGDNLDLSKAIVDTNESFGDDSEPKIAAQWKGSNQLSCLVSEKSRYLTADPNTPHHRKEIVILDTEGKLVKILSKDWPDELLNY